MRNLKIITCLLIFGFTLSYVEENSIFNIEYLREFEVPNKDIPGSYYFRLEYPSTNKKLGATIKSSEEYYGVEICVYTKYPTDEKIKMGSKSECESLNYAYSMRYKTYEKLIYRFNPISTDVIYLVLKISISSEFKYLSVLVSPFKNKQEKIEKEIEYDKELIIDSKTLSYTRTYFIFNNTESKNGNGESMTIKLHKDDVNDLNITFYAAVKFEDLHLVNPSYTYHKEYTSPEETKDDGEYKIYKYSYPKLASETKCLLILIISRNNYGLLYFSFTLNSSGLSGGIIALIVILSIIVILVVTYFVLRKSGIIQKSIFTCFK